MKENNVENRRARECVPLSAALHNAMGALLVNHCPGAAAGSP